MRTLVGKHIWLTRYKSIQLAKIRSEIVEAKNMAIISLIQFYSTVSGACFRLPTGAVFGTIYSPAG